LTNSTSSMMGPVIAYRVLDELLGVEPIDWATRFKDRYDAALAGAQAAKAVRPRVEGARPPRPLDEYAGDYEHPGYGIFSVTADGDSLLPRFGTLQLTLAHRHFEVFDLEWHELGDQSHSFPVTFLTNPEGDVVALTIPFEPS